MNDSTNKMLNEGDRVRFRGRVYTIKRFWAGEGQFGCAAIEFEEDDVHTNDIPDEIGVDVVEAGGTDEQ